MEYLKHSAAIIIRDKKILLIKRGEKVYSEAGKWCPVNETVEIDEDPKNCVVRGVLEEVGLSFVVRSDLGIDSFSGHQTFLYLGDVEGEIIPSPDEVAEYGWFTYEETGELIFAYNYKEIIEKLHLQDLL